MRGVVHKSSIHEKCGHDISDDSRNSLSFAKIKNKAQDESNKNCIDLY